MRSIGVQQVGAQACRIVVGQAFRLRQLGKRVVAGCRKALACKVPASLVFVGSWRFPLLGHGGCCIDAAVASGIAVDGHNQRRGAAQHCVFAGQHNLARRLAVKGVCAYEQAPGWSESTERLVYHAGLGAETDVVDLLDAWDRLQLGLDSGGTFGGADRLHLWSSVAGEEQILPIAL